MNLDAARPKSSSVGSERVMLPLSKTQPKVSEQYYAASVQLLQVCRPFFCVYLPESALHLWSGSEFVVIDQNPDPTRSKSPAVELFVCDRGHTY